MYVTLCMSLKFYFQLLTFNIYIIYLTNKTNITKLLIKKNKIHLDTYLYQKFKIQNLENICTYI